MSIVKSSKLVCVFASLLIIISNASGTTDRESCEAAYKKDNHNQLLKYQWATVAPCSTALKLYKEIADTSLAPDSLRAKSYGALGEYYYSKKEYKKSAQMFQSASKRSKLPLYRNERALSLYQFGDYETAKSLWSALAKENKNEFGLIADYHIGLIYLKQGNFVSACSSFVKCGDPDSTKPLTLEALSARLFCLEKLGRTDDAAKYREALKPYKVASQIKWASISGKPVAAPDTETVKVVEPVKPEPAKESFTVQVGAFGSQDNATAFQKKLQPLFKNVSVATVTLDDKVFYRVRIGTFTTKEQAEQFVEDSVLKAGYTGKAVPSQY